MTESTNHDLLSPVHKSEISGFLELMVYVGKSLTGLFRLGTVGRGADGLRGHLRSGLSQKGLKPYITVSAGQFRSRWGHE